MSDVTITLHGHDWTISDLQEAIDWARRESWQRMAWVPGRALVPIIGQWSMTKYTGQSYDENKYKAIEGMWDHDHCEICYYAIGKIGEVAAVSKKGDWICGECYLYFIYPSIRQDSRLDAASRRPLGWTLD